VGEEFGSERGDAEWVWVLDPIDGTKSFMTACPLFGTLIASCTKAFRCSVAFISRSSPAHARDGKTTR